MTQPLYKPEWKVKLLRRTTYKCGLLQKRIITCISNGPLTLHNLNMRLNDDGVSEALKRLEKRLIVKVGEKN